MESNKDQSEEQIHNCTFLRQAIDSHYSKKWNRDSPYLGPPSIAIMFLYRQKPVQEKPERPFWDIFKTVQATDVQSLCEEDNGQEYDSGYESDDESDLSSRVSWILVDECTSEYASVYNSDNE